MLVVVKFVIKSDPQEFGGIGQPYFGVSYLNRSDAPFPIPGEHHDLGFEGAER